MKKRLPLLVFTILSCFINAQSLSKPSTAVIHKATQSNRLEVKNEVVVPLGTICFQEKGSPETVSMTKTNYTCSVKQFTSQSEAESFAIKFKNSDANIADFSFSRIEGDFYFFNFTIKEPKDTKWYLMLFKNNNLQFIKYNKDIKLIDDLLSK